MRSFSDFFFVALLPLSYRLGKFRTSYAIGFAICKATGSSFSSFKLLLVDLTVFPNLNLRLGKIKLFTTVCIAKFLSFCSHAETLWRRGVVVITAAQLNSTKSELRLCAGSNPARGVLEIRDGEDL